MKHIKTQKVYTFPDRKLYGEYCAISLLELRIKIVEGEIKEELCILDEDDRAYCFDKFSILERFPSCCIDEIQHKLLTTLLHAQMAKRKSERL